MDAALIRRLASEARVGRLATVDPDGRPNVVPFVFVLAGDTVYTSVDAKPKRSTELRRVANVRDRPEAVTVLVDHYEEQWPALWWARLRGRGRIVDVGEERERALALLREKYPQYVDQPPEGPVIAIDVEEWLGWSGRPLE